MSIVPKAIDPCKVAIYIRWSTDDQSDGTTLDVQLEGCRHYVLSQGWTVSEELTLIDDGYSGGSLDRPALARLREAVARGDVDCVVVFKLDRLSRDVPDMIRLILDEWDGRCFVKSAREPVDTTTHAGRMFFYTLASFAEWERNVIKERVFSGKLRRAQEGKNPGMTPPYGYTRGEAPGSFAEVPHEAAVVRRIFALYRHGHGTAAVAFALNAEGLSFRDGRPWNASTVRHMLRNPAYKGELVYGVRRAGGKRGGRVTGAPPHVTRAGVFPAIVSPEEWEVVQGVRRQRPGPSKGTSGRSHASPNLLTGLLRCGRCGRTLKAAHASYGAGVRYRYYICDSVHRIGPAACDGRRIRQETLDAVVVEHVKRLYASEAARRAYVDRLRRTWVVDAEAARGGLAEVKEALGRVEARRKKLRLMVLDGDLTTAEYRVFTQDISEESRGLEARRAQLSQTLKSLQAAQVESHALVDTLARVDTWDRLSRVEQKALLRTFIERVEAYVPPGSGEVQCAIAWRVPMDAAPVTAVKLAGATRRARRGRERAEA